MGIDISHSNPYNVGLNPKVQFNNYGKKVYFGVPGYGDSFQCRSPYAFFDENYIKQTLSQNPEIKKILAEHNIPVELNLKELEDLKSNHCKNTLNIAVAVANNLPPALRYMVNMEALKDAALLHDFGKVLIPAKILNKPGAYTPEEHKIMDLHTELGYQMLKNSGVNEEVLNLIRRHHDNNYPDINLQILNVADKYSALTEKRVYKDAMTPQQALTVIYADVKSGKIEPLIFNALVQSLNKQPLGRIVNNY